MLGPLLYIIFTNDLPEAMHHHLAEGPSKYNIVDKKYKQVEDYMTDNKTHLLIMATPFRHRNKGNFGIILNTGSEIKQPNYSKKLL